MVRALSVAAPLTRNEAWAETRGRCRAAAAGDVHEDQEQTGTKTSTMPVMQPMCRPKPTFGRGTRLKSGTERDDAVAHTVTAGEFFVVSGRLRAPPQAWPAPCLTAPDTSSIRSRMHEVVQHDGETHEAAPEGTDLTLDDLPSEVTSGTGCRSHALGSLAALLYREATLAHQATRVYLEALLESVTANVSKAAEKAGLARESLHRLPRKHGVDPDVHRS